MSPYTINIDKLSAFRYKDIVKYLQSIYRALPSINIYPYNLDIIDKFTNLPTYETIFNEVAMCDNYVKLTLSAYEIDNNFAMIQYIEQTLYQSYQIFLDYREALLDQAQLLIEHVDSDTIEEINNNIHEIVNTMRPEYYFNGPIETEILQTYTPFNVNIEDVGAIWFEDINDYKYILQRCEDTLSCEKLLSNNIKHVKDLYHTFYTAGIQVVYDLLIRDDPNEFDIGTSLINKLASALFLDIKLRDCQSKQTKILDVTSQEFEGHLQWRQTIWNDAVLLCDISKESNELKKFYISSIFNDILSNVNDKHRVDNIYNKVVAMTSEELLAALTRFIPN
jgi:hypothetical protein